jgi:hypothetical protein
LRRRFRSFWMIACFCSRAARCRALLSLGTERHATQPSGHGALRALRGGFERLPAGGRRGRAGAAAGGPRGPGGRPGGAGPGAPVRSFADCALITAHR